MEHLAGVAPGVVVGYDGSPSAGAALDWAVAEASRRRAPLTVLHAVDCYGAWASALVEAPHLLGEAMALAREVAEEGAARAHRAADLDVRLALPLADATTALLGASRCADVLVVGCRGRGPLAGALLGSVAFSVSARALCPVVVVRGPCDRVPGADRPVVVGCSGTPSAQDAVPYAAGVAARAGARLRVVGAWVPSGDHPATPVAPPDGRESDEDARQAALVAARAAREDAVAAFPDLDVETVVIRGAAGPALAAASWEAGLVVVGSRGLGRVSGPLLGSVSRSLIAGAGCPITVVRPWRGHLRQR